MRRVNEGPPLFHFGIPMIPNKTTFEQICSGVNAGMARCPLTKLRDLVASGSMMDSETLKSLFPSLFREQNVTRGNKKRRRKTQQSSGTLENKPRRRLCIDVRKLDEISCLSTVEKNRFKNVIDLIRCDSESQGAVSAKAKTKKRISKPLKRAKRSCEKENLAVPLEQAAVFKDLNELRKNISKARGHQWCPECNAQSQNTRPKSKVSTKSPIVKLSGLNATSQERLLQALINLETDSTREGLCTQQASHVENEMQPNRINIKNFKVKYVSPTYVVQYNGEEKPPDLTRERIYSNVALESHLGHRAALTIRDEKKDRQSMHYENSTTYIVGKGVGTEQMMRERLESLESRQNSPEDQEARAERATWLRESLPSYLKHPPPPDSPRHSSPTPQAEPSHANSTPQSNKSSRCQRLMNFLRRVLCMSDKDAKTEVGPDQTEGQKESAPSMQKGVKRKVTIRDEVQIEAPCVRTTKSEFLRKK